MAHCGANAGAAGAVVAVGDSGDEEEVVDTVKYTICGILASSHFDRKAIQQRSLKVRVLKNGNLPREYIQVYFLPQFKGSNLIETRKFRFYCLIKAGVNVNLNEI